MFSYFHIINYNLKTRNVNCFLKKFDLFFKTFNIYKYIKHLIGIKMKFDKLVEEVMTEAKGNKNQFKKLFKSGDKLDMSLLWGKGEDLGSRTVDKFDGLEYEFDGLGADSNLGFMPFDVKGEEVTFYMNGEPYMKVVKK